MYTSRFIVMYNIHSYMYIHIYIVCTFIYIHTICIIIGPIDADARRAAVRRGLCWRTNGVNTNGAAAKIMNFDRLQKKYTLSLCGR